VRYGIWLYPWDLLDFGPDRVVDELRQANIVDVCLAVSYHSIRALLPDNPRRKMFHAREAGVYFEPRKELWAAAGFEPRVAPMVVDAGDALAALGTATSGGPLRLVGWTVCLHDSGLPVREPDLAALDIWGSQSATSVCLANPRTRQYASTLVADVAPRVDAVQLEAAHWLAPHAVHLKTDTTQPHVFRRLSALCVCEHCMRGVEAERGDPQRLQADLAQLASRVLAEVDSDPVAESDVDSYFSDAVRDSAAFQRARTNTVNSLVADLQGAAGRKPIEFLSYSDRHLAGVDLRNLERLGVDVRLLAYGPPAAVSSSLANLRAAADAPTRFGVGLSALPSDARDADALRAARDAAIAGGAASITYYNYGLLTAQRRGWLRELLAESPA